MAKFLPVLDSYSTTYSTDDNDKTWTHTFNVPTGKNGVLIVGGTGQETGGEENPEEINVIYYVHPVNGWTAMTKIGDANQNYSGYSLYYVKYFDLPAGTTSLTLGINFKSNPKTPDVVRTIAAAFRNVKNQACEASAYSADDDGNGGNRTAIVTTLKPNALVVGFFGERTAVSFSEASSPAFTAITTNTGGENNGYLGMYYRVVTVPAAVTFKINATNPENNGIFAASFEAADGGGAALFGMM